MPQMKKSHQKRRWSARNLEEETIPGKPPSDGNTGFGGQIAGNFCFFSDLGRSDVDNRKPC